MFGKLKEIFNQIISISKSLDKYKKDTIIQSLPSLTYVNRAKKFIEKNDFIMAEKFLTDALSISTKDPLVYKYLGLVYEKTGVFDLAVKNYQLSADLNPNDKNIWQRLGFALVSASEYEKATKAFDNANHVQPNNTDTFTGWGMALTKLNKYSEAYDKFLTAIKINKYNFSALFLAAIMEIKLGMYDKADNKLSFLTNVAPNEGNTFEYARLKALKDDIENAINYAQKSLTINPNMLPAYILLGQLYAKKSDKENTFKYFEAANSKGMKTFDFYFEWGKVLLNFENFEDAKEKFALAKEIDPDNINLALNLALCTALLNNIEESKAIIDDLKTRISDNKDLNLVIGIIEYKQNNIEQALHYLRTAEENAISSYFIAKCYELNNDDTKTIEYYETSIRYNPTSKNIFVNYVNYLINKDNYQEAQRKLRKALKYNENDITLLNLMFYVSYVLVKQDFSTYNIKEVISIAEKIEKLNPDLFEYPRQKEELEKLLSERE